MRYASAAAFRQALEERLKNEAAATRRHRLQQQDLLDTRHDPHLTVAGLRRHHAIRSPRDPDPATPGREGTRLHPHLRRIQTAQHPTKGPRRHPPDRALSHDQSQRPAPRPGEHLRRARSPTPTHQPSTAPSTWADPYKRLAATVEVESDLSAAHARAAAFLDPVLAGHAHGHWDTHKGEWA